MASTKKTADPPAEAPAQPSAEKKENKKPDHDAQVAEKPASPERPVRLLLLTPGAPLLIDFWLTLDGRPHGAAFDELVQRVLAAADTDHDGRPTWKEFIANDEFLASPLGGGRSDAYQGRIWIENYDVNRDGALQTSEATSWLGRDGGAGASAFSVRSSRAYPPNPRANSRVWEQLDADADGVLSAAEIAAAHRTLLSADADDDLTITPVELATLREQLQSSGAAATPIPRDASRYAVIVLDADNDLDRLQYLLTDLYSPRQALKAESFALLPRLFEVLDVDRDGVLDQIDVRRLTKIDAYLELAVDFVSAPPDGAPRAAIAVRRSAPELSDVAAAGPDRVMARLGDSRLVFSATDLAPATDAADSAQRRQVRAMVHDQTDALFADLDTSADGRLGERELQDAPQRLLARDANGDGQLTPDELPVSMIVALLRSEPPGETTFYVPPAVPPTAGAEVPPWFRAADFNADGDLSRREFLGPPSAFDRLDANGDGYIDAAEAAAR